jgi:hypothetical protein
MLSFQFSNVESVWIPSIKGLFLWFKYQENIVLFVMWLFEGAMYHTIYKWIIMSEKWGGLPLRPQWKRAQMNNRQRSMAIEKVKSLGNYSTANPDHLLQKWAELAVVFSW